MRSSPSSSDHSSLASPPPATLHSPSAVISSSPGVPQGWADELQNSYRHRGAASRTHRSGSGLTHASPKSTVMPAVPARRIRRRGGGGGRSSWSQVRPGAASSALSAATVVARCAECGHEHACAGGDGSSSSSTGKPRPPWRRILYERQPYSDNYVDASFLSTLVTNANVRDRGYWQIVLDTVAVTQRVAVLAIFTCVFFQVLHGTLSVQALLASNIVTTVAGAISALACVSLLDPHKSTEQYRGFILESVRRLVLFAGVLLILSPVLQTLTVAYSSDTIWLLTFVLFTIHMATHDYSYINGSARFQGAISLNASVFASVLMASRLPSASRVFAVIFLAFQVFAGLPIVARLLKKYSWRFHVAFTSLLCCVAFRFLAEVSKSLTLAFVVGVLSISLACPFFLKWVHRYKNEMQGPWDYDAEQEMRAVNL